MNSQIQEKPRTKQINVSLNVMKCLAIFAVMCGHSTYFLGTGGLVLDGIIRFTVPFFFLISGFFSFFTDNTYATEKYKARTMKLFKLMIISNLIFFIYFIITNRFGDNSFYILWLLDIHNIFNFLILNVPPTALHLWFIQSLLYCYIIYYFLSKFQINPNRLYKYIPILFILCLILGEFFIKAGIKLPIEYYRNFLFMGLPFFALGYLIHDKEDKIKELVSNRFLICLIVFGCMLAVLEVLTVGVADLFISSIMVASGLFIWCIKNPVKLQRFRISSFIGQNLYASMYVLHLIIAEMLVAHGIMGYLNPFIVFILTAIVSYIIYLVLKNIRRIPILNRS